MGQQDLARLDGSFDVVIVGNGVAGFACARALARRGTRPLLVGPGLPFDRPPLSKGALAAGEVRPYDDADSLSASGIMLLDGSAVGGDLARRRVVVAVGDEEIEIGAAALVVAVGLSYEPIPVPGLERAHVNATVSGFRALVGALRAGASRKDIVVVGAGLIGVETAATLAGAGHRVTLSDVEPRPLARLHAPLPAVAEETLESLGIRFVGGAAVSAVHHRENGAATVELGNAAIDADLVVAATGAWQRDSGWLGPLPFEVDERMGVENYAGVFAVGDCVSPPHARWGRLRMPHWDVAIGTAERAAATIHGEVGLYDRLPYWWTDIGPLRIAEIGYSALAVEWASDGSLHVGRDVAGRVVCCTVVNEPRRLRTARELLGGR